MAVWNVSLCALTAVLLFVCSAKNETVSFCVLSKVHSIIGYIQAPFVAARTVLDGVCQMFRDKTDLISEISGLRSQILQYEQRNFDYNDTKEENAYLKEIAPTIKALNAESMTVVSRPARLQPFVVVSTLSDTVLDKISVNDIAISAHGLFGRVVFKDKHNVFVLLATNLQSRIPVRGRESNNRAILLGDNSVFLKIKYVKTGDNCDEVFQDSRKSDAFIDGEILETLDTGGFFTKAIQVAKIEHGERNCVRAKWLCGEGHENFITVVFRR
jgi:cell shape-determining protein MreC